MDDCKINRFYYAPCRLEWDKYNGNSMNRKIDTAGGADVKYKYNIVSHRWRTPGLRHNTVLCFRHVEDYRLTNKIVGSREELPPQTSSGWQFFMWKKNGVTISLHVKRWGDNSSGGAPGVTILDMIQITNTGYLITVSSYIHITYYLQKTVFFRKCYRNTYIIHVSKSLFRTQKLT